MNLRKMLAVFLLSLVAAFAFAFDGAIVGGRDGELARKDFLKAAADEEYVQRKADNLKCCHIPSSFLHRCTSNDGQSFAAYSLCP